MNYEFALDKKSIISVVASWILIGVLLFVAGWLVGRQWPITEAASTQSPSADEKGGDLPREPLLKDEAPAREGVAAKKVEAKVTPPAEANATAPEDLQAAATAAAAAQPPSDGRVVIISEAETEDAKNEEAPVQPEYVTVQVGVFLDEKDASRLLKEIETKGYSASFFTGRDSEARQWYAVRIGMYSDKQQAASAAANFTKHEGIKAVVRPFESL